jgi:hypothetical protein
LVNPPRTILPVAPLARAHWPPPSLTCTVDPVAEAVAVHLVKAPLRLTAGVVGTLKPAAKTTVIELLRLRAPPGLAVKPAVHDATAPASVGFPANVTLDTLVAAAAGLGEGAGGVAAVAAGAATIAATSSADCTIANLAAETPRRCDHPLAP